MDLSAPGWLATTWHFSLLCDLPGQAYPPLHIQLNRAKQGAFKNSSCCVSTMPITYTTQTVRLSWIVGLHDRYPNIVAAKHWCLILSPVDGLLARRVAHLENIPRSQIKHSVLQ